VEEAYGIAKRILDEHALGVASDDVAGCGARIVGEQDRGFIVAEVFDEELAEGVLAWTSLLFRDPWGAVLAVRDIELKGSARHTHNALDDAIEQAEMFRRMRERIIGRH
jgi:hypothetical protein